MRGRREREIVATNGRDLGPQVVAATACPRRDLVVTIGIDAYRHWSPLARAVSDARGARAVFHQLGFADAAPPLYNDDATGAALLRLVTDELATLNANDSLVVFFAGHGGTRIEGGDAAPIKTGYLIPVDADNASNQVTTWIDLTDWLRRIARLPPRHILVILDACYSGIALDPVFRWRTRGAAPSVSLEALEARRSRRVITSALDDQLALDSGPVPDHSLFTGCLIETLRGGIPGGDAVITGSTLGSWVQRRVTTYPGSRQTPDFGAFDRDERGELTIALRVDPAAPRPVPAVLAAVPARDPGHAPTTTRSRSRARFAALVARPERRWTLLAVAFWIVFAIGSALR